MSESDEGRFYLQLISSASFRFSNVSYLINNVDFINVLERKRFPRSSTKKNRKKQNEIKKKQMDFMLPFIARKSWGSENETKPGMDCALCTIIARFLDEYGNDCPIRRNRTRFFARFAGHIQTSWGGLHIGWILLSETSGKSLQEIAVWRWFGAALIQISSPLSKHWCEAWSKPSDRKTTLNTTVK